MCAHVFGAYTYNSAHFRLCWMWSNAFHGDFTNLPLPHCGMTIPTVAYPLQHLLLSDFLNFCQSDRQMNMQFSICIFFNISLLGKKNIFS